MQAVLQLCKHQHHACLLGTCLSQVYPLSEVAEAHKQVEDGHTRGKVVLKVE